VILEMSQRGKHRAKRVAEHGREKWSSRQHRNRRELGQNFLKDKRVARRIVAESGAGKGDLVVELGAGGGILTRQLAKVAREVVAVEYDPGWASRLEVRFLGDDNVRVVQGDALAVKFPDEPFVVVANIPFNITTSILHSLLDDPTAPLQSAHLLVQKHVALKHSRSVPTTLNTLSWSPWYALSAGLELPAAAFHPKPEVDACLMVAAKRISPLVDPHHRHLFRALVRQAFGGHGSSVFKTLKPIFTKTQLRRLARDNGFSVDSFPSMLTVHQWASVFDVMIRMVPRDRWPSAKREAKRESWRR
jgi:23S rRNA (adenine-N6)-dimethyltransferase